MRIGIRAALLLLCALLLLTCFAPALADFGDFDTGGDYGGWDSDSDSDGGSILGMLACIVLYPVFKLIYRAASALKGLRYRLTMRRMDSFAKQDPNFDEAALAEWVRDLYRRMQAGWEEGDIASLAPEFTEDRWQRFNEQLQKKRAGGFTGHVRDIKFYSIQPEAWCRRGGTVYMDVSVRTSIISWNTDARGAVRTGSATLRKDMAYVWRLQRAAGKKTDPTPRPCPECGQLNRAVMSRCPKCQAPLVRDPEEWIIYDIGGMPAHMK